MRFSLIPAITFVLGAIAMASYASDIGPDSSEFEVAMAGWIIKGIVAVIVLSIAEFYLRLKRKGSSRG